MSEDRKHIDNFFHNDLDQLGELPPAGIWKGIDNALTLHDAAKRSSREKRNRYAIALLLLVMVGSGSILWLTGNNRNNKEIITAGIANKYPVVSKQLLTRTENSRPGINKKPDMTANTGMHNIPPESFIDHAFEQESISHISFETEPVAEIDRSITILNQAPVSLPAGIYIPVTNNTIMKPPVVTRNQRLPNKHRFSVMGFFAPDITTRNLEQDLGNTPDEGKEQIMQTEKNGKLDYTFGARVEYRLNKHFSIQSGLSLSRNTIDIAAKTVYARFDKTGFLRYRFNMSSGYSFFKLKKIPAPQFAGDSAQTSASNSTLHYINIPLAVKYNFSVSEKIELSVQAGITARFIAWERISTTYDYNGAKERSISKQIEGLKKSYFNGVVGVGAEYTVAKHLAVVVFPSFNFATSSINKNAPVKAYPNTLSIATGVKFNF